MEQAHIGSLYDAAHDPTVLNIRPPLGQGALSDWVNYMVGSATRGPLHQLTLAFTALH